MASMYLGYKTLNKHTGEVEVDRKLGSAACWAPLKWSNSDAVMEEVLWSPNKTFVQHHEELLPLLFPDVEYEIVYMTRDNTNTEKPNGNYTVRFKNLANVYRNSFVFRLFVIRNIDRDMSCNRAYTYLTNNGYDPLMSAVVAANIDLNCGFTGDVSMRAKGYARCMSTIVSVADVRAFARDPSKVRNKARDSQFNLGDGFGYRYANGRRHYDSNAAEQAIAAYKPTKPQFASLKWGNNIQVFLSKLFNDKKFLAEDLPVQMYNSKEKVVK